MVLGQHCTVTDGGYRLCKRGIAYTLVKALCATPETDVAVCVNYPSITKKSYTFKMYMIFIVPVPYKHLRQGKEIRRERGREGARGGREDSDIIALEFN